MFIDYTPEQHAWRKELRAYFAGMMTDALRHELLETEGGGPLYHAAMQQMGRDGLLGLGWDTKYGGKGRPPIEEFIFFDEVQRAGFPIPLLTLNTVGPTLCHFGTEEQHARFLPGILRGECHFSIGYTEPDAGTDLASLKTRAVRDGDHYVINGQKIWHSLGNFADYIWLACKTDPAARHKGISIIVVPTDAPGVSMTPMRALGDNNVHALYLEDVRVPVSNRVGPENGGWRMITTQLNHERVALMSVGPLERLTEETLQWARRTPDGRGGVVLDSPWVQRHFAEITAKLEVLRLMNWKQAWQLGRGHLDPSEASAIKVYGSEFYVEGYRLLLEVLGESGLLKTGTPGAVLRGEIERYSRATLVLTFGGGVNEVQRTIIATAGLGLPRMGR